MAVHNESKIQEIQDAAASIIGAAVDWNAAERPVETLQNVFAIAHDPGTHRIQTGLLQQVLEGNVDYKDVSIRVNAAGAILFNNELKKTKEKQAAASQRLMAMLDELAAIADAIDAANDRIDDGLADLKADYGDDYIYVVAGSILTPDEIDGCETEDDLLILMAQKAFDDDGNLRPGFEHLDPRMIQVLRDVKDRQDLKARGAELVEEYEANGRELTPELEQRAVDTGIRTSVLGSNDLEREEGSNEVTEIVRETSLDTIGANASGGF